MKIGLMNNMVIAVANGSSARLQTISTDPMMNSVPRIN